MIDKEEIMAIGNARLRRLATYASVGVALILIVAKLAAYMLTDSVAMLSSLLDSTIDLLSSMVTVYGVANALRPPDHEHRFGHGKAEPLTALAQAAFIVGSSVLLGYEALSRLYHLHTIVNEQVGYTVMGLAVLMTVALIEFQRYVIHRTSSMAIDADRLHYLGDLVINIAVAVAFALHQVLGIDWLDPLFAMAITLGLIISAFRIAVKALQILMDQELPEHQRTRIKSIVESIPAVQGLHDLRTRSDSDHVFIELHVELDGTMRLHDVHDIVVAIETALRQDFPKADVIIHQDPAGLTEHRRDETIAARALKSAQNR